MSETLKLLAVFAHPDDESMGLGGVLAKYAAEGIETYLVCATRGERGWAGVPESDPGLEGLGKIRTKELEAAGGVLGLKEIQFLDYVDGDLDQANPREAIQKIASHIRRIKPQVVVTFGPDGAYGHPDHIAISQFASAALICAADAGYADDAKLPAHRVQKLYFMVDSETFGKVMFDYFGDFTFNVGDQARGAVSWKEWSLTTRIDISTHVKTALDAIRCHESQLPTIAPLLELPKEKLFEILNLQGTFYRAFSVVNGGRNAETDLFEGLR
jgi:LmbE family N-acetylglucosaminyl deacetylase